MVGHVAVLFILQVRAHGARVRKITMTTCVTAVCFYMLLSVAGYLSFGALTQEVLL